MGVVTQTPWVFQLGFGGDALAEAEAQALGPTALELVQEMDGAEPEVLDIFLDVPKSAPVFASLFAGGQGLSLAPVHKRKEIPKIGPTGPAAPSPSTLSDKQGDALIALLKVTIEIFKKPDRDLTVEDIDAVVANLKPLMESGESIKPFLDLLSGLKRNLNVPFVVRERLASAMEELLSARNKMAWQHLIERRIDYKPERLWQLLEQAIRKKEIDQVLEYVWRLMKIAIEENNEAVLERLLSHRTAQVRLTVLKRIFTSSSAEDKIAFLWESERPLFQRSLASREPRHWGAAIEILFCFAKAGLEEALLMLDRIAKSARNMEQRKDAQEWIDKLPLPAKRAIL